MALGLGDPEVDRKKAEKKKKADAKKKSGEVTNFDDSDDSSSDRSDEEDGTRGDPNTERPQRMSVGQQMTWRRTNGWKVRGTGSHTLECKTCMACSCPIIPYTHRHCKAHHLCNDTAFPKTNVPCRA